jgi:hypothetical protein
MKNSRIRMYNIKYEIWECQQNIQTPNLNLTKICSAFACVTCELALPTLLLSPSSVKNHSGKQCCHNSNYAYYMWQEREEPTGQGKHVHHFALPCCQKTVLLWCLMLSDQDISCDKHQGYHTSSFPWVCPIFWPQNLLLHRNSDNLCGLF